MTPEAHGIRFAVIVGLGFPALLVMLAASRKVGGRIADVVARRLDP